MTKKIPIKKKKAAAKKKAPVKKKAVTKKKKGPTPGITAQQIKFADHFIIHRSPKDAAIFAGYSTTGMSAYTNANRLLKENKFVMAYVAKGIEEMSKNMGIDAQFVLMKQVEILNRCMQIEPIRDSDGEPTGEFKFEANAANKAIETIGKHINVNAFKAVDDDGAPIDQNWKVEIVHTDRDK